MGRTLFLAWRRYLLPVSQHDIERERATEKAELSGASSYKDIILLYQGSTIINSSKNLPHFLTGPVPKYSHIGNYGFNGWIWNGGDTMQPTVESNHCICKSNCKANSCQIFLLGLASWWSLVRAKFSKLSTYIYSL